MRAADNLRALEKLVEQEILTFFVLLGAGEAPEDWQADLPESAGESDSEPDPAHPPRH